LIPESDPAIFRMRIIFVCILTTGKAIDENNRTTSHFQDPGPQ
jgi:hypothetical protein